jgi:hypothetical protein
MIDLISEAAELQKFLEKSGWEFYFIGGIAVQVWGQPRLTRDIDLTIFTNLKDEENYIRTMLERYAPKFSNVEEFALTERVLPLKTARGIGIDMTLGGIAELNEALERSSYQVFTNKIALRVCSPDDLIIMKTVAGRPRDWVDIESVLIKQTNLDWAYIEQSIEDLEADSDIEIRYKHLHELKNLHYEQ